MYEKAYGRISERLGAIKRSDDTKAYFIVITDHSFELFPTTNLQPKKELHTLRTEWLMVSP